MLFNSFWKILNGICSVFVLIFTLDKVSAKLRLRPPQILRKSNDTTNLTIIEEHTKHLFDILSSTPEFNELKSDSCADMRLKIPDFRAPGRRISDVKCLEYLWQIRYNDELLLRSVRCGVEFTDLDIKVIIYGDDAENGDFPHMGALGWKAVKGTWIFKCGATLISDKFMLTAAHCSRSARSDTKIADPVPRIVRLGETNILDENEDGSTPIDVVISRIIVHEKYRSPSKYFDIAIIELETPVPFTMKSHPACIWNKDIEDLDGQAFITGWGIVEAYSLEIHPKLQVAIVDLVNHDLCDRLLKKKHNFRWRGLARHQLCAGIMKGGVDTCQGDSGGPLQMDIDIPYFSDWSIHFVAGITSFGYGCARPNTPSVYIKVSNLVDWIESVVWKDEFLKENNTLLN